MADRRREFTLLVVVLMGWAATPVWSDDYFWPDRGVAAPDWTGQDSGWQRLQSMQLAIQPMMPPIQPAMQPPIQPAMQPAVPGAMPAAWPAAGPAEAKRSEYDQSSAGNSPIQQAAFGNRYALQDPRGAVNPSMMGGAVSGRLLNGGRPLVNCHVVIVPLLEADGAIHADEDRKPLSTITDENGVFHFDGVPAGGYKLTWLPAGQKQWIRRIAMRPDVHVHNGETTVLKEIRIALHTIN